MFKGYDKFTRTNGGESYANYLEHEQRIQGKGSVKRHGVYLAHEEKMEIRYIGNICERVGWKQGDVLKVEEWEPVARNRHAITGEQLTKEHSKGVKQPDGSYKIISDRKMHCDTTVSMPKSFSLLYALAGEGRVLDWHQEALRKALGEWTGIIGCQANNRNGSKGHMEITGKYAGTHAIHFFSRNGDPNVHSHIDIANVTEGANGKLYAIDFRNLMDHYGYLTSVYRDELARLAMAAGYEVVKGKYEEPQIAPLEGFHRAGDARAGLGKVPKALGGRKTDVTNGAGSGYQAGVAQGFGGDRHPMFRPDSEPESADELLGKVLGPDDGG